MRWRLNRSASLGALAKWSHLPLMPRAILNSISHLRGQSEKERERNLQLPIIGAREISARCFGLFSFFHRSDNSNRESIEQHKHTRAHMRDVRG